MGENNHISRVTQKRSFIATHKRWFSFASTAIVLGTFIVIEALRNQAKDLAASIATAQTNFTLRSDIRNMGEKLEKLDSTLSNANILVSRVIIS